MAEENIRVTINGQVETVPPGYTIAQLVAWLGHTGPHVLVEHNRQYIFPEQWSRRTIHAGDRLELIHPLFGG